MKEGATIFPSRILAKLRQLLEPKYPAAGRERVLEQKLGGAMLSDAVTDVIVTAYDIERREPVFFRSALARRFGDHDVRARDVALATSAAPTYFPPVRLPAPGAEPAYALVDGGVYANNPGMCAFVDDSTVNGDGDRVLMVSLGTGVLTRRFEYEDAKSWGLVQWAPRLLDVVFGGISDTVDYQLKTLLGERYHRLQVTLDKASDSMDDASSHNLGDLVAQAHELIERSNAEVEAICTALSA